MYLVPVGAGLVPVHTSPRLLLLLLGVTKSDTSMNKLFPVIAFLTLLPSCQLAISKKKDHDQYAYLVFKIKRVESVYEIFARRNDSVFEIISPVSVENDCNNIHKGAYYNFKLCSQYGEGCREPLYFLGVNLFGYNGTSIDARKAPRGRLYTDRRMSGLCLPAQ
jgi:hypothetical protein